MLVAQRGLWRILFPPIIQKGSERLILESLNGESNFKNFTDAQLDFAAKLGLGPKYKPEPRKTHTCLECGKGNAYYREEHPDTDMNEIVLFCPDCRKSFPNG